MQNNEAGNFEICGVTANKIVASATELFNLNGFSGTSIGDITKKAGTSKGILYHYFKDKDALYLYCVNEGVNRFLEYMDKNTMFLSNEDDIIFKVLKVRLGFLDVYPQYRFLLNSITSLRPNHLAAELTEIKMRLREDNLKRFKRLTKDIEFGKGITDYDIMAFLTILQNNAHFIENLNNGDLPDNSFNVALRLTKIFINGLKEDIA